MSEPSSAIVVRIGLPPPLERVRRQFDRAAALGPPAHVTILYPWLPAKTLNRAVRASLATIVGDTPAFTVRFAQARRWPGVVYLEPEPAWRFTALIDRVVAGFPGFPPYAGAVSRSSPTSPWSRVPRSSSMRSASRRLVSCRSNEPSGRSKSWSKASTVAGGRAGDWAWRQHLG